MGHVTHDISKHSRDCWYSCYYIKVMEYAKCINSLRLEEGILRVPKQSAITVVIEDTNLEIEHLVNIQVTELPIIIITLTMQVKHIVFYSLHPFIYNLQKYTTMNYYILRGIFSGILTH